MSAIDAKSAGSMRPLLIDIKAMASLMDRSVTSIQRDDEAGRIPASMMIGGSSAGVSTRSALWVRVGCPDRAIWESRFRK